MGQSSPECLNKTQYRVR